MFKRFWWVFLVMAGMGTFLLLALARVESKKSGTGPNSNPETTRDRPAARSSDFVSEEPDREIARESSRHSAGEIERHQAEERRLLHLKKAIRDQEEKVEEKRKVLATIVRAKGIIYKGPDADYSAKPETPEEAAKKTLDAQDYVDAKRDFEIDQKSLQEMKLKLLSEKIVNEPGGR